MANTLHSITVADGPIPDFRGFGDEQFGAEVAFRGVVRGTEGGRPILAIEYSGYRNMAESVATGFLEQATASFGRHALIFHHALGHIGAGKPSILVAVGTPHSEDAYRIAQHYLKRAKTELPIWKKFLHS